MKQEKTIALILVILASACMDTGDTFNFRKTDMRYYEFVYEDLTCETICFEEYIVHSNGLVLIKKETRAEGITKTGIDTGTIDKTRAEELIQKTENLVGAINTGGVDCRECQIYHIFYGDPEKTASLTGYAEDAPEPIKEIGEETRLALKNIKPIDPYFMHFIYKKPGNNSIDYHIYPDGTVLKEEFGQKNGELIKSAIYTLSQRDIEHMIESTTVEYFTSEDNLLNCNKNGLEWGYLEIKKDSDYRLVYTCGTGNSAADRLFNEMLRKTGGM